MKVFNITSAPAYFNSTIVRLKLILVLSALPTTVKFQFYNSAIKANSLFSTAIKNYLHFNSTIVRLKPPYLLAWGTLHQNFNSTIVRLKQQYI